MQFTHNVQTKHYSKLLRSGETIVDHENFHIKLDQAHTAAYPIGKAHSII